MIADFHFLRPLWLAALLAPLMVLWLSSRAGDIRSRWKGMIAPHLLDRLVIAGESNSRLRPSWVLAACLALAALAAAGPSWQREASPFVEDAAALMIAVDLSPGMDAIDIAPSRVERVKLKIRDIVEARKGARTGVLAYSGSAHLVLPLTEDASLIESYTEALATRIMPVEGKDSRKALQLAEDMLKREQTPGTILFMTDGIEQTAVDAFKQASNGIIVLGVGTEQGGPVKRADGSFATTPDGARMTARLDVEGLKQLRTQTGAQVATVTPDDSDVRWVTQRIRTDFAQKQANEGGRWQDKGWLLVIPLVFLFGLSFRKGWVVKMSVALFALQLMALEKTHAAEFINLWLTPDQQGQMAYRRGDFAAAAELFHDPAWKGVAWHRAGQYSKALDALAFIDTAESWFNQGDALMHLSRFDEAVAAYNKALAKRPDWPEAQANLALAEGLLKAEKEKEEDQPQDPSQKPDEVQFDDKGKKGKAGQIDIAQQTAEMWMNNIQTSPTDLMARKFSIEAQKRKP